MIGRRKFLAGLLAAGSAPRIGWAAAGSPAYLAAARDPDSTFALYGLTTDGAAVFRVPLPARGHAGAGHPTEAKAVVFARRPGAYALVIDCVDGAILAALTPPDGMQFNGHGVFIEDGAVLVTVEQVAATSEGRLGLWDSTTWARIGDVPTGGIGPHDVRLMPDRQTLVIANGGIATDPTDRTKLNLVSMEPSLVFTAIDGQLLERVQLGADMRQASIRHLAVRSDGLVAFAMQWEGAEARTVPLLGLHQPGAGEGPVLATPESAGGMRGYAGSVAWDGPGEQVVVTSPKGGMATIHDAKGAVCDRFARPDICGAAPLPRGHLTSDGSGGLIALTAESRQLLARHDCAWDNHIVTLG